MERLWTSNVSISNCKIKKIIFFAINLPLKLFLATVTNGDSGSLKSLHTIFDTYIVGAYAGEIWTKSNCPKCTKFRVFWQKLGYLKAIFDKMLTSFWKIFLKLKQVFNGKQLSFRISFFSVKKKYGSPTCKTRLNVPPNMADLTSIKHAVSILNVI